MSIFIGSKKKEKQFHFPGYQKTKPNTFSLEIGTANVSSLKDTNHGAELHFDKLPRNILHKQPPQGTQIALTLTCWGEKKYIPNPTLAPFSLFFAWEMSSWNTEAWFPADFFPKAEPKGDFLWCPAGHDLTLQPFWQSRPSLTAFLLYYLVTSCRNLQILCIFEASTPL